MGPGVGLLIGLDSIYSISSAAFLLDKGYYLGYIDLGTVSVQGLTWLVILWFPLFRVNSKTIQQQQLKIEMIFTLTC